MLVSHPGDFVLSSAPRLSRSACRRPAFLGIDVLACRARGNSVSRMRQGQRYGKLMQRHHQVLMMSHVAEFLLLRCVAKCYFVLGLDGIATTVSCS